MVECPADDCEYAGPKRSVLGHYSGKPDENHPGGYQKAKQLLADADDDFSAGDNANFNTDSGSASAEPSTSNPVMGNADPDPQPDDTVELPCGHESYDPADAPDPPFRVNCSECGDTWRVKA